MEIVIARVRLLEILVESPPRVIAAWLLMATAQVCRPNDQLLYQNGPWKDELCEHHEE